MEQSRPAMCGNNVDGAVMTRALRLLKPPQTRECALAKIGVTLGFSPQNAQKERKWTRPVLRCGI